MVYGTFATSSLIGDIFEPDHQLVEFYHAIRAGERVAPSRATTRVPTPPHVRPRPYYDSDTPLPPQLVEQLTVKAGRQVVEIKVLDLYAEWCT